MRVLIMSDLHLDQNSMSLGRNLLREFIDKVNTKKPDIVLIAGDICNFASDTIKIIRVIENQVGVKVLFIPGNHDIWVNLNESSMDAYNLLKNDPSSVIDKPYFLNDEYVVVGDMGWYDYTFAPSTISNFVLKSRAKTLWDGKYTRFGMENVELFQMMYNSLKKQLDSVKDKKVIFMNHFIPYKDFVVYKADSSNWDLCNGYMGSAQLGELLDSYSNIEYVIFGHTHKRFGLIEYRKKQIICNPLGYVGEWKTEDFNQEIEDAFTLLEL